MRPWCSEHNKPEDYVIDPYTLEIYDEEEWMWLCEDCYGDRCDEI